MSIAIVCKNFYKWKDVYKLTKMSKPFVPFRCTNNTQGSIDYGIPIVANKATDFRTSTGSYHRLLPNVPQNFDCRVKARIRPGMKDLDVVIRDMSCNESTYKDKFDWKFAKKDCHLIRGDKFQNVKHIRPIHEKLFRKPPPVKPPKISEMKENYYRRYITFSEREVFPPEPYEKCEISALGRDEQPPICPEEKGYWKLQDPYLTTNRATYVPFSTDRQNGIARKDIITFYDVAKFPKGKGFGPRNPVNTEPLVSSKKVPMVNTRPFKKHPSDKYIHNVMKRVPNFGKTSEMKASYVGQSFSEMSPYLFQNSVVYPESLSNTSPWQDLSPPAMYCTESCHLGSGYPINSVVDYGSPPEYVQHIPCYAKFCDWTK